MKSYPNGKIPKSELVQVGVDHWLTRGTAARWAALVADVKKNEGVTLRISKGKNAYRDYAGQVQAKKDACARGRCGDASAAGFSSHGGVYRGRDSMAIDVANWAEIGKTKFYAYARKHGFEPGFFDWEPWHIIDWSPWTMPTAPGGGSKPNEKPETPEEEEDDMPKNSGVWYKTNKNTYTYLVFNTGSGFGHEFSNGREAGTMPGDYTAGLKLSMDLTSWSEVTPGHAAVIKSALVSVRPKDAPKEIDVTIVNAEELAALSE